MTPGRDARRWLVLATLLGAGSLAGQADARLIADLGDPARSEAAERALVALGAKAAGPLADALRELAGAGREQEPRALAMLRVIGLLGPDAADVEGPLYELVKSGRTPAYADVLWAWATLAPYTSAPRNRGAINDRFTSASGDEKGRMIIAWARLRARESVRAEELDALLACLASNAIFAREIVAERLGRLGDRRAIEPLHTALLARGRPQGWDQLRHNGFVVPIEDEFRLRAGEAMLRLDPDDPRCAIAWACRAALHPHRSVRAEALASLARFGAAAADAVPELVTIARGADPALAAEALKLLGTVGPAAAPSLAAAEELAANADPLVARRAQALVAQLRALGAKADPASRPTSRTGDELRADALALGSGDGDDARRERLVRAGAAAVPALQERLRRERAQTPAAVLRLLGSLGRRLSAEERAALRCQVLLRNVETWLANGMATATSGSDPSLLDREVYGELVVGEPTSATELATFLAHENSNVRLAAAQRLAERRAMAGAPLEEGVGSALLAATEAEHPTRSAFKLEIPTETTLGGKTLDTELTPRIQATAAVALVGSAVPEAWHPELLAKAVRHDDDAAVCRALQEWGSLAALDALTFGLRFGRPKVAVAAAQAIARLGPSAAAALPSLETAASSGVAEVAAAARRALAAVRGG